MKCRTAIVGLLVLSLASPSLGQALADGTAMVSEVDRIGVLGAGNCTIGPGLGSTLLFPLFVVDLADPLGFDTILSITNGLAGDMLARVVVWTDWGVPTLAFDVYLRGFDIQNFSMRQILSGNIPSTGSGADLTAYDFCGTVPPFHVNPALTSSEIGQAVADHTGQAGPIFVGCAGEDHGDELARGYVTVDVVDECSGVEGQEPIFTPADRTDWPYFADGGSSDGIAIISNRLFGDLIFIDAANDAAQGSSAVSLWADADEFELGTSSAIYTFYGRYSGWDGRDDRVPLPDRWDGRFFNGGAFAGGSEFYVWRDTGAPPTVAACGTRPGWYPLTNEGSTLNEESDNFTALGTENFPLATQKTNIAEIVDDLGEPIGYNFGFFQLGSAPHQAWMQNVLTSAPRFSVGFNAAPVNFLCDESPAPPMMAISAPPGRVRREEAPQQRIRKIRSDE